MTTTIVRSRRSGLYGDVRELLELSTPIMLAQGGLTSMGLVDTFMIGRISAIEMGGVALGNGLTLVFIVFGLGLTMGTEPLVAQANGAGETNRAYGWYQQGLWAALLSSVPVVLLCVGLLAVLPWLGISAEIAAATSSYVWFRLPSIPANAMYGAARSYLTCVHRTRPIAIAVIAANVANVALDYVFVFALDMGAAGVGAATSICWALMFLIVALAAYLDHPPASTLVTQPDLGQQAKIIRLGWPIGLQLTVEVGVFAFVGLLVGRIGEVPLASHQIALGLASFTFMLAVGIGGGASALVGNYIGAGRSADARRIGIVATVLGGAFMAAGGVVFLLFDTELARLFAPTNEQVVVVGAELLQIAALFSVSDGVQAVSAGALRGVGETKWPFYANAGGHWLIGLPLGLVLMHYADQGAHGLWYGLTAGLTVVAVVLGYKFLVMTRGELRRIE